MKAVLYGAGAFLLISVWLLVLALQLIPTDIGNTYLLGAFLFIVGAGLMVSMVMVAKVITHEIKGLNVLPVPRLIEGDPVVTLPQIPISSPVDEEKAQVGAGAILATGAVVTAAGVVAGGMLGGVTRAEADSPVKADDRFLDDLERDLFADIGKESAKPFPMAEEAVAAEEEPASETEDAALLTLPGEAQSDAGEGDLAEDESDDAEEAVRSESALAVAEHDDLDDHANERDEEVPEPPASTPGLIADADLAALQDDEPVLAPLETLDIVGAYDSGGTRFTMYSDGSVTALGEGVDRRFKSLDDLRAFIDGGMKG